MNAERLHAICRAIRADLDTTSSVSHLSQLATRLQELVNSPQQPQPQQQVSQVREQLRHALADSSSNAFSPVWVQVTEEIGAAPLLGSQLSETIEEIFARNEITPSVAQEEIQRLAERLTELNKAIDQVLQGFASLEVGNEDLEPGECELAILVPRKAVQHELPRLGQEFEKLQKIFGPFAELATGSRPPFVVKTISSSDFSLFLELAPEIAACVAIASERVVAFYKQLLEIRLLRQQLKDQGVPDKSLGGIDEHANSHMENGISQIVDELLAQNPPKDIGRTNELRTELTLALNQIANRVDAGYNVDVRAKPPESGDSEESTETPAEQQASYQTIIGASENLRFFNRSGESILALPEEVDDEQG